MQNTPFYHKEIIIDSLTYFLVSQIVDVHENHTAMDSAPTLVKAMLSSEASIVPDPSTETLTVRLLHQARRGHDLALAPLLEEFNRTRTLYPGTNLRLVYEILPHDPGADGRSASDSVGPSGEGEIVSPLN